ncbi:MAG: redoxin domain-containing protein [Chitinophagaceae bacterium]
MKKFQSLLVAALISMTIYAQSGTEPQPAYLRFPTVPPIKILKVDSATYFTKENLSKKKPTIVMVFNPGCEHCQHETEEIIKNIDEFKDIQVVMATPQSFTEMKDFYKTYKLANYSNIIVGRDEHFTLPSFYSIRSLPFLAFYDKKQNLISAHEGSMLIPKMLEEIKKDAPKTPEKAQ